MKIEINLSERFGRQAVIRFDDYTVDAECPQKMREALQADLKDLMTVFGGLTISIIEDRLAAISDHHGTLEEVMSLIEKYAVTKIQYQSGSLQ